MYTVYDTDILRLPQAICTTWIQFYPIYIWIHDAVNDGQTVSVTLSCGLLANSNRIKLAAGTTRWMDYECSFNGFRLA